MPKKLLSPALIIILSFVIAIVGIINDILVTAHDFSVMEVQQICNPLNLAWVFGEGSTRTNGHNYVNAFFDILLLVGAFSYVFSKRTTSRLIRFFFSIVILSNILQITFTIYFVTFVKPLVSFGIKRIFTDIIFLLAEVTWIFLAYHILRYFRLNKQLKQEVSEENGEQHSYYINASKIQRFLHPVIDSIVCIALFSPILQRFVNFGSDGISRMMFGESESFVQKNITLIIVVIMTLYYLFYESVLGTTPAKLITKTRTINYEGAKPAFKNIFIRTVSRLVPFEAFSFLLHDGWHDKWSETIVVKEE